MSNRPCPFERIIFVIHITGFTALSVSVCLSVYLSLPLPSPLSLSLTHFLSVSLSLSPSIPSPSRSLSLYHLAWKGNCFPRQPDCTLFPDIFRPNILVLKKHVCSAFQGRLKASHFFKLVRTHACINQNSKTAHTAGPRLNKGAKKREKVKPLVSCVGDSNVYCVTEISLTGLSVCHAVLFLWALRLEA